MNVLRITKERYDVILPSNIKESELLTQNDKKVLGGILHYFAVLDKAKENGYVILTDEDLRKTIGIRNENMRTSVQNLVELKLINKVNGKKRTKGEKAQATRYYVNWDNLQKPIEKPSFEVLFSSFLSPQKPSENNTGTVDIDVDTDEDIDKDIDKDTDEDREITYYNSLHSL